MSPRDEILVCDVCEREFRKEGALAYDEGKGPIDVCCIRLLSREKVTLHGEVDLSLALRRSHQAAALLAEVMRVHVRHGHFRVFVLSPAWLLICGQSIVGSPQSPVGGPTCAICGKPGADCAGGEVEAEGPPVWSFGLWIAHCGKLPCQRACTDLLSQDIHPPGVQ